MPETDYPDYKTYLRPFWEIRIQYIACDNTGSLYTSTPTHEGNTHDPTRRPPHESAYVNFMNKHCLHWTYNTVRVQEEGSNVCGFHCIFYLIHRCAGHSMTDVTRLLENPVEVTEFANTLVPLCKATSSARKMWSLLSGAI